MWLVHGWKALHSQIDDLEDQADTLKIELSGDVFERLMEKPSTQIEDKDSAE